MNVKGFTLTELVIALLVSGIILLTIGIISQISTDSYMRLRQEAEVYNEIYSSFDLVERSVRRENSTIVVDNTTLDASILTADGLTFFRVPIGNSTYNFTYSDSAENHTILANATNLTFNAALTNDALVTFNLTGEKHKVPFNLTIDVTRRN